MTCFLDWLFVVLLNRKITTRVFVFIYFWKEQISSERVMMHSYQAPIGMFYVFLIFSSSSSGFQSTAMIFVIISVIWRYLTYIHVNKIYHFVAWEEMHLYIYSGCVSVCVL